MNINTIVLELVYTFYPNKPFEIKVFKKRHMYGVPETVRIPPNLEYFCRIIR